MHSFCKSRRYRTNGIYRFSYDRDYVLRACRPFDVRKQKPPFVRLKSTTQFHCNTGFTHTTLAGQQHVVSIPHTLIQYL